MMCPNPYSRSADTPPAHPRAGGGLQFLLADTRQLLHRRTAYVLAEQFSATVETQPELLAQHYTEAGLTEPANAYWQRALQHSAHSEAIRHLTRARELLATRSDTPGRAQQELDLQLALGRQSSVHREGRIRGLLDLDNCCMRHSVPKC
jgi:predicted ATPase